MKIVFLDIDGVLSQIRFSGSYVDAALVNQLNWLTNSTGAKVVIHSSRRYRYNGNLNAMKRSMRTSTFEVQNILDMCDTPTCHVNDSGVYVTNGDWDDWAKGSVTQDERAIAIQRWLDRHPEVTRYVILDDCPNLGHFVGTRNFIQVDPQSGLTKRLAKKAAEVLSD